jgi:transposase IS4-like protein
MSRTVASLPPGSRITDYISLGVVAKTFPLERIRASLAATRKESVRERDLPAHVVVYYVIALALYMQSSYREVLRCLLEGMQWLVEPGVGINLAGIRASRRREPDWDGSRCGNCTMTWSNRSRWRRQRAHGIERGV